MAKKEVKTDLWVYDLLKQADINLDPQGSSVKEIDFALRPRLKRYWQCRFSRIRGRCKRLSARYRR